MKHISFTGEEKPFTVKAENTTIKALRDALNLLIDMGYGDTNIIRADSSGDVGFTACNLELYDTKKEKEQGYLDYDTVFLIC